MPTTSAELEYSGQIAAIPADDHADFYALTATERDRVQTILAAFAEISASNQGIVAACQKLARRLRHKGRGYSWKNLYNLHSEYRKAGRNWRVITRNYQNSASALPEEFIRWWTGLVGDSPRQSDGVKAVYNQLIHQYWYADRPVPGYGRITEWWPQNRPGQPMPRGIMPMPGDLPTGWSYENLLRNLPKRKAIRTLMQRGHHAAHGEMMQLLRDRSGLLPMQMITFDDVRLDLQALFEINGKLQVCYVNAIFALDVGMAKVIGWGIKPRFKRDDDTHSGIERADVRFLLLDIFERRGLPPYEVNLLLENAAAALTTDDRAAFEAAFPGRLRIETTGMARRQLLTSGFGEDGGMPWQKGWIESYFRLLQTRLALAPGSTGNRYDNDPGTLQSRLKYTRQLIRLAHVHPEKKDEIIWPVLTEDQLGKFVLEMVEQLNWRTDHRLQGFAEVHQFRLPSDTGIPACSPLIPGHWYPIAKLYALPPEDRMAAEIHAYRESPAEREKRLLTGIEFSPVHPGALYALASDKISCRVRRSEVRLTGKIAGGDPLVFPGWGILTDAHEGREYTGFLSQDKQTLHLFTPAPELAYTVSLHQQARIDLLDEKGIKKAAGEVHRSRQALAAEAASYQERTNTEHAIMRANNAALFPSRSDEATPSSTAASRFNSAGQAMQTAETARRNQKKAVTRITEDDIDSILDMAPATSGPSNSSDSDDLSDLF